MSRAGAEMSSDTILDSSASGDGDASKCDDDCQTTKFPRLRGDLDGHMMRLFPPLILQALGNLYSSLNSPSQLSGWATNGSDPCGESWKGISCSGSSVTSIQISGLGLNGTLRYLLSNLVSVKSLDLSNNKIHDVIPYQLPSNVTYLNLANNNLSGSLPYSVSTMYSLVYLNASYNILSQTIGDIFTNLQNLSQLDLSVNNFLGDLPNSIGSLSNLSSLYLQDNQLTGQVNDLTNLSLTTLNIANNHFTGPVPQEFRAILNLMNGGNSFADSPAPTPPPYSPPPPRRPHNNPSQSEGPAETPQAPGGQDSRPNDTGNRNSLTSGQIAGIVIGSVLGGLCMILAAILCFWNFHKEKDDTQSSDRDSLGSPSTIAEMRTNSRYKNMRAFQTTIYWILLKYHRLVQVSIALDRIHVEIVCLKFMILFSINKLVTTDKVATSYEPRGSDLFSKDGFPK